MRQVVLQPTLAWCTESSSPITVIGDAGYTDYDLEVQVLIEGSGFAVLGGRVWNAGCVDVYKTGILLKVNNTGYWTLISSGQVIQSGQVGWSSGWHKLQLQFRGQKIQGSIDSKQVLAVSNQGVYGGWAAIGSSFSYVQFDNFVMNSYVDCGSGTNVLLDSCSGDSSLQWTLQADGTIHNKNPTQCLDVQGKDPNGSPNVVVSTCNNSASQQWIFTPTGTLVSKQTGYCVDLKEAAREVCTNIELYQCNGGDNQQWNYVSDYGLIVSPTRGKCLGLGAYPTV